MTTKLIDRLPHPGSPRLRVVLVAMDPRWEPFDLVPDDLSS